MNSATVARQRLDWVISHDRARTPGRVKMRRQESTGPFTRVVFDQPVTVLPDEVMHLEYDDIKGEGSITIKREVNDET